MAKKKQTLLPKLRFSEFEGMADWEQTKLRQMTTKVGSGITPQGGSSNYLDSGRPFIRSQNVGWGSLILDDIVYIDDETHQSFVTTEVKIEDVLLNITGASIGRTAVANSEIEGGNVNQHVCVIRTKGNELVPLFLNQFIISQVGQSQIESFGSTLLWHRVSGFQFNLGQFHV
jgi:type I restriction enzyme S subunit